MSFREFNNHLDASFPDQWTKELKLSLPEFTNHLDDSFPDHWTKKVKLSLPAGSPTI